MSDINLYFDKVIDINKWQKIQEEISKVTKMSIVTIDYKGNLVSEHSNCSNFCKKIRGNKKTLELCKKCDSRGGLEAIRNNKPHIYLCHYNLVDIAIPISVNGTYLGAIMAGQVRLGSNYELEQIVPSKDVDYLTCELKDDYEKLTYMSYAEIKNIANMLFLISNYIVERSILNDSVQENNKLNSQIQNITAKNNNKINFKEQNNTCYTLEPALEYLKNNVTENISIDKMATICHISPSYFSRLFSKEVGENFCNYQSRLKVEASKSLLKNTNKSVNEISDFLGFSECGYFIKTFKKYQKITPSIYRQENKL